MATTDYYSNDLFQKLLQRAIDHVRDEVATSLDLDATFAYSDLAERFNDPRPQHESPLEAGFEIWWKTAYMARDAKWYYWDLHTELQRQADVECGGKAYRLDFRVIPHPHCPHIGIRAQGGFTIPLPKIGVELDGHGFHEKTQEQVTRRNQRDRDLHGDGWRVFHFSGSEFVRHPLKCVEEVMGFAHEQYMEFATALAANRQKQQENDAG